MTNEKTVMVSFDCKGGHVKVTPAVADGLAERLAALKAYCAKHGLDVTVEPVQRRDDAPVQQPSLG